MKYSIIIPTCCSGDHVFACLPTVMQCVNPSKSKTEIIIVENGSDNIRLVNPRIVKHIKFKERLGFPRAVNVGLETARGEWLVILNDDALLPAGWLEAITPRDKRHLCGVRGANLGIDTTKKEYFHAQLVDACFIDQPKPVDYCGMQLFCMHRSAYQQIGNLDENFGVGYCEDADYGIRARALGFVSVVVPMRDFYHHEHATTSRNAEEYNALIATANRRLYKKYHE